MKDKLLIITKIKNTIEYIDKTISNFPNKERDLKSRIINTMYNLLENTYYGNINKDNIRREYQNKIVIDLRMLDYYLKLSMNKKIISLKKYTNIGNFLLEINDLIVVWVKCEKNI